MNRLLALILAGLFGCSPAGQAPAAQTSPDRTNAAPAVDPHGQWRIIEVNGRPAIAEAADPPNLLLRPGQLSGSTGCNRFWGTSLVYQRRLYVHPLVASERGCGTTEAQEETITRLLMAGPSIEQLGISSMLLRHGQARLRLTRKAPSPLPSPEPPMLLAGTRWDLTGANGQWLTVRAGSHPRLQFEADQWTLTLSCGKLGGRWRQQGERLVLQRGATPEACGDDPAAAAVARMVGAQLGYAAGPKGELVLAGNNNFITGRIDRDLGKDDSELLAGEWRVVSIDRQPPVQSPEPPRLTFRPKGYLLWDGCNESGGIHLTHARQLFILPSDMSTAALCEARTTTKVHVVLGGQPRVARTERGIALVARTGRMNLERLSPGRKFPSPERTGLWPGLTLDLKVAGTPARLLLGSDRNFAIQLPCGTLRGNWRPGQPAGFTLEPIEKHAPACPAGPGSAAAQLERMFQGEVQAVVDGNNERVLLLNHGQTLAGRVAGQ